MVRSGLKGVLASVLALAVASATDAARAEIPGNLLKVGVLSDLSGPFASQAGPGSVAAAQLSSQGARGACTTMGENVSCGAGWVWHSWGGRTRQG